MSAHRPHGRKHEPVDSTPHIVTVAFCLSAAPRVCVCVCVSDLAISTAQHQTTQAGKLVTSDRGGALACIKPEETLAASERPVTPPELRKLRFLSVAVCVCVCASCDADPSARHATPGTAARRPRSPVRRSSTGDGPTMRSPTCALAIATCSTPRCACLSHSVSRAAWRLD